MTENKEEQIQNLDQSIGQDESFSQTDSTENSILTGVSKEELDQLTKRNLKFMLDVDRHLRTGDISQVNRQAVYQEMVDTLLEGQKNGQTAKHLYGTPLETSQVILAKTLVKKDALEKSPDWQIAVDGGLMLGAVFTLITGFFGLTSKTNIEDVFYMGILTVILNYAVGGYAMMKTSKVLPNLDAPKGEKGYGRYFLVSTLAMMGWIGIIMVSQAFIPSVINPILPPIGYIILGVISLALRYYLKNKWKIVGGLF